MSRTPHQPELLLGEHPYDYVLRWIAWRKEALRDPSSIGYPHFLEREEKTGLLDRMERLLVEGEKEWRERLRGKIGTELISAPMTAAAEAGEA